jgi:hypothetical protein
MGLRGPGAPALKVRFWRKVDKTDNCWNWTASTNAPGGYGQISDRGRPHVAHRLSYEWANGPIPDGMVVDHMCHNRLCVNPGHLRAITQKQNTENRRRGSVLGATRNQCGNWVVRVKHNGRLHYGGTYGTVEEAAKVARDLRNELFTHNDADRGA